MPEDGVFVAVLTNGIAEGRDPEAEGFRVSTLALGDSYVDPTPVSLGEMDIEPLVGVYVNDAGVERYITRDGARLFSQRTGGAKFEVHPLSPMEFFYKDSLSRIKVRRTEDGGIGGLEFTERIGPVDFFVRTDKPLPKERKEIILDPAVYDRLVGEYELNPGFTITITRDGRRLMGQATGQENVELFPESETAFFLKVADARIVFSLDASGKATGLTLCQGGLELPAKKIK
jgi:D-alanyl-D-alanine carboxypeptidase